MYIDNALNLAYSYAEKICNQAELDLVSDELIKIAGKTDEYTFRKDDMKYSYSETQNMLSKLNEKESIRKSQLERARVFIILLAMLFTLLS